jgi:hypothetical protein
MNKIVIVMALAALGLLGAGCGQERAVRQRAQAFTQLLMDEKYDAAVDYYDPDIVTKNGRTTVVGWGKLAVGIGKGLNRLGGRQSAGFQVRKIDFDSPHTHATVQVVYVSTDASGGERKEFATDQMWVLKNGVWYATHKETNP